METASVPSNPGRMASDPASFRLEDWQGGNQSLKQEYDYWIEDVEGTIPPDLEGTLFRNGPALLDLNGDRVQHPFDGDGMVHAIAFRQGRAHYRNRYVRTKEYVEEQTAGTRLYRGVFGTQKPGGWLANAFDFRLKNIANTNVVYWGDRLMALWEASHPHRLDPYTLRTEGIETLEGALSEGSPFAAHPMIDPGDEQHEPRYVSFGLEAGLSTTLHLYELDESGTVVRQDQHSLPGFAFIHDFAITPHYCLFFQNPLGFNPLPFALGFRGAAECISFKVKEPTKVWVIPRDPSRQIRIVETPSGFVFHHANAFEDGDEIVVDSVAYEDFPGLEHDSSYQEVDFDQVPPGQLWRFRLNPATGKSSRQKVVSRSCDMPYVHPQRIAHRHHWVYLGAADQPEGNAPMQAILKVNPDTGEQQLWSAAPKGFVGEPVFVPRPGSEAEDDGWVLTLVYDAEHHRTDVAILDGRDLEKGAIARLHLKNHIPYGLHGCFTPNIVAIPSE
ncbi:MAG: carotenoid oxygenase family protein [Synechococcales bacterium]|nr:carotenoid oxygenase family protein [Synechococcales bacterium]